MEKFSLAIVRPVAGHKGELIYTMDRYADSISAAVKATRLEVEGSGWIVLQKDAFVKG